MSGALTPSEIFDRAKAEGERRLAMPALEQSAGAFIAGITIVFGIVAQGMAEAEISSEFGPGPGRLAGALAFAIGLVFLVVGRTELFSENFLDPVASVLAHPRPARWTALLRLWGFVLVFNLLGAAIMAGIFVVPGALPDGAPDVLIRVADEIAAKGPWATLARAIAAGALLTLLSYLLHTSELVLTRGALAYIVGFLIALGPFDHVVVSTAHLLFGWWFGGAIDLLDILVGILIATFGNLIGGVLLMTLTHAVQVVGGRRRA